MTEQEKRRHRREMERRMRAKGAMRKKGERGGLALFRAYVTVILVGGCLLISAFHTKTSERICKRVQEVIAVQMTAEELAEWRARITAFWQEKEISLPAFGEKEGEEEKSYHPDTEASP